MSNAVMQKIEELFGDPEKFTPENMESLVHETLRFFEFLKSRIESKDEKERDEALRLAQQLKGQLEEQAMNLCKSAGMDPATLEAYLNNTSNFTREEWEVMEKAKAELNNYKEEVQKSEAPVEPLPSPHALPKAMKKKPKAVKEWLIS